MDLLGPCLVLGQTYRPQTIARNKLTVQLTTENLIMIGYGVGSMSLAFAESEFRHRLMEAR